MLKGDVGGDSSVLRRVAVAVDDGSHDDVGENGCCSAAKINFKKPNLQLCVSCSSPI